MVVVTNKEARNHCSCAVAGTSSDTFSNIKENVRAPIRKAFKNDGYTNTDSEVHSLFVRLLVTDIQEEHKKYRFRQFDKKRVIIFMRHF
jgi:hypothetical protein